MEQRQSKAMNVISMRRFLTCIAVTCAIGAVSGLAAGLMDWSDGVSFVFLTIAGTIMAAITLREPTRSPARPRARG